MQNSEETQEVVQHCHKQQYIYASTQAGCREKETVEDKKSLGDAPSESVNRWLFTSIKVAQRRNSTGEIVHHVPGIVLTYTVNEFMFPRVKFLPKAAPVDCALLPFTLTRHFLSFLSGGHEHGKRKHSAIWTRTPLCWRGNHSIGKCRFQSVVDSSKVHSLKYCN